MTSPLYCPDDVRRALVRADPVLNGIDYLEVLDDDAPKKSPVQRTLLVHCLKPVTGSGLGASNVHIDGGVRITPIHIEWASPAEDASALLLTAAEQKWAASLADAPNVLLVRTRERGDLSTYRLSLRLSHDVEGEPPSGFDVRLVDVDFSFKVECPSEFDCLVDRICSQLTAVAPHIDYLAKDYASFKRLMLDRLAVTLPDFTERNPADLGIALVELLAYVGDYLSYYQDAVAQEAYLGTARRRVSLRRHARLLDYRMHEGSNARTWVAFEVEPGGAADGATLPRGTMILGGAPEGTIVVAPDAAPAVIRRDAVVFETLHELRLSGTRNVIAPYTWGDPDCCLPEGATRAALTGSAAGLGLERGDVLIFEEVLGEMSGLEVDADPAKRHAARLSDDPVETTDALTGAPVLEVRWHDEDALPYPLCLKEFDDGAGGVRSTTVIRGNVALADAGRTVEDEELSPAPVAVEGRYTPLLEQPNVTHARPYRGDERDQPAAAAMRDDASGAMPQVELSGDGERWRPQPDLMGSDAFSTEFVVEIDDDGRARVRFGDGIQGRRPSPGATFTATYRVGNGPSGNVGADALGRVVTALGGITRVSNPLPATGGTAPEPKEHVRLLAPHAFRVQKRAVTEDDYARVAERHPEVQKAAATRRWTGSWHTMFVTVDRRRARPIDDVFEAELRTFLEDFRLAGYDIEIDAPRFVPLDIVITVCVGDGHFRSNVKAALLNAFSARDLPGGRRGFFHPDNFTFAQPVYLSQIIAAAMEVPGVAWIDSAEKTGRPNRFRRWGHESHGEHDAGVITFARLEIARLDNDPNAPENGRIDFVMRGGL